MKRITIFSWGYWGWGSSVKKLIQAADAVEIGRGFDPPLFVDIRARRNVRAKGFRDDAFAEEVGADRYVWMKELGNRAVLENTKGIQIINPKKAAELLEIAIKYAKERRRIIFFCSCEAPSLCHRNKVAKLLQREAVKRGIKVEIIEWPGGRPQKIPQKVTKKALTSLDSDASSIALGKTANQAHIFGIPWTSVIEASSGMKTAYFISGPAFFQRSQWYLHNIGYLADAADSSKWLREDAERWRKKYAYSSIQPTLSEAHHLGTTGSIKAPKMKALTLRPVWAWAAIYAGKNIENRSWRTHLRGPIAIHASKGLTRAEYENDVEYLPPKWQKEIPAFEEIPRGAIIGVVDLVGCVTDSKSRWFNNEGYGFVLKNARVIRPIECTGALGFWDLPANIERKIKRLVQVG